MAIREFTKSYDDIMRIKGKGITLPMKLIYCRILRFTENDNKAFPSLEFLANEFGIHENTVTNATNKLVDLGVLVKHARFNSSNVYEALDWNQEVITNIVITEPLEAKNDVVITNIVITKDEKEPEIFSDHNSCDYITTNFVITQSQILGSNRQSNIQLNKQTKDSAFEVIESVDKEIPHKVDNDLPVLLSDSVPPLIPSSQLANEARHFTMSDVQDINAFRLWDISSPIRQMYPNDLSERIKHYINEAA